MVIEIIKQETGRFDRRFAIGPAVWPCFDLLWIHTGVVRLRIGTSGHRIEIAAPGGVVIFPNVAFEGRALGEGADASVTHFRGGALERAKPENGYLICGPANEALSLQAMVSLSMEYARRDEAPGARRRLLAAIVDGFRPTARGDEPFSRLEKVWAEAAGKLENMRSLTDVAALAGLSESTLRALHRAENRGSAGRHLLALRLEAAERLLETTGMSVREISKAVGYAHPESFSAAFKRRHNRTPLAHRRLCQRLA